MIALTLLASDDLRSQHQRAGGSNSANLSQPVDWGVYSVRIFKDANVKFDFTLATSWIPGEGHKGFLRYRTSVALDKPSLAEQAKNPELYSTESIDKLMRRVHDCEITLELLDEDDFKLRTIVVPFGFGVDDEARIHALYANESSQMDVDEYRKFIGDGRRSGHWAVGWECSP